MDMLGVLMLRVAFNISLIRGTPSVTFLDEIPAAWKVFLNKRITESFGWWVLRWIRHTWSRSFLQDGLWLIDICSQFLLGSLIKKIRGFTSANISGVNFSLMHTFLAERWNLILAVRKILAFSITSSETLPILGTIRSESSTAFTCSTTERGFNRDFSSFKCLFLSLTLLMILWMFTGKKNF